MPPVLKQNMQMKVKAACFFTPAMQQITNILESPSEDLFSLIDREVAKNPFLYWKKSARPSLEQPTYDISFQAHISLQIRQELLEKEQGIAHKILEELDERGYYLNKNKKMLPLENLVRKKMLLFDPVGTASISLQECLLAQLEEKNKKSSLSYRILEKDFSSFLQQKFVRLARKYGVELPFLQKELKKNVKSLYMRPRAIFEKACSFSPTPDVVISKGCIQIDPHFPPLYWKNPEKKEHQNPFFKKEARLLESHLKKRAKLLLQLVEFLLEKQKSFFYHSAPLSSLSVKDAAKALQLHPAHIRRVINRKHLSFEGEIFSLRFFFSRDIGGSSQNRMQQLLQEIIKKENKKTPLSDEKIANELAKKGCYVSRRTVAKYRKKLRIPKKTKRTGRKFTEIL